MTATITMHGYMNVFIAVDDRTFEQNSRLGGKVLRCESWTPDIHATVTANDDRIFLYGNVASVPHAVLAAHAVMKGFCRNVPDDIHQTCQRPESIHNLGVFIDNFFNFDDTFNEIARVHRFQTLTESNKSGQAHRTGIYLSHVHQDGRFHLLRCSTNLDGPTEAFQPIDQAIIRDLNRTAGRIFTDAAELNHVLAQIYRNTPAGPEQKQTKARIAAHSDKTKDMPANAIMAFCTFYDRQPTLDAELTQLRFRRKADAPYDDGAPREWSVLLRPNSVLFIPLQTNRTYTHEIRPSHLDASRIPTRMGYVVRCSRTQAIHCDGQTHILVPLQPPTEENMTTLRHQYIEENSTSGIIEYGNVFFSMNSGDYKAPIKRDVEMP